LSKAYARNILEPNRKTSAHDNIKSLNNGKLPLKRPKQQTFQDNNKYPKFHSAQT